MKKDIQPPKVEKVMVAIIEETNEIGFNEYNVFIINSAAEKIEGVLVSSKGYGYNVKTEEKVVTNVLRHFLDELPPKSYKKIEPIMDDVFGLNNEYWVSFFKNKVMYDKKFIFVAESINKTNFRTIPIINKKGVMIE